MTFADDEDIAPLPECIAEIFARVVESRQAPEGVELDLPYYQQRHISIRISNDE